MSGFKKVLAYPNDLYCSRAGQLRSGCDLNLIHFLRVFKFRTQADSAPDPKHGPKINCLRKLDSKNFRWTILKCVHIPLEIKEAQLKEL